MFITLLIVDGKWNPKTEALVLLAIGTLSLFLLTFFMKQMDGALKQDCLGVNIKHHANYHRPTLRNKSLYARTSQGNAHNVPRGAL